MPVRKTGGSPPDKTDNTTQKMLLVVLSFIISIIVEIPVSDYVAWLAQHTRPDDVAFFWFLQIFIFLGVVGTLFGVLSWVSGKISSIRW